MSGIAELLANLGYSVSGSDAKSSDVTRRLASLGVRVAEGHAAAQVGEADVVVVSSAVRASNPEVVEARSRHIPVVPRAEMLAELMRLKHGIAIAGAHGKTTTTSMVALVLDRAGLDPTAVIGGRLSVFGSSARLGQGAFMVAEADESDGSFLKLSPVVSVITNIDREHLDHYGDFDRILAAFTEFANKVPFYGAVVACLDDPHVRALRPQITRRIVSYGIDSADADLVADEIELAPLGSRCRVRAAAGGRAACDPGPLGELRLNVPGRHNLLNALAALGVGLELGLTFDRIAGALLEFRGAERRFQVLGEASGVTVVDDYGHHPTEIAAVIDAARAGRQGQRLIIVFQPHRYTRTRELLTEFGDVLARADEVVLTDIYAASEDPLPGIDVDAVADSVRRAGGRHVHVVRALADVPRSVVGLAKPGDLVITLGAGSIGTVGARVLEALQKQSGVGPGGAGSAGSGSAGSGSSGSDLGGVTG
jgi:UDP-N-acetylmuramate--alanine ligase